MDEESRRIDLAIEHETHTGLGLLFSSRLEYEGAGRRVGDASYLQKESYHRWQEQIFRNESWEGLGGVLRRPDKDNQRRHGLEAPHGSPGGRLSQPLASWLDLSKLVSVHAIHSGRSGSWTTIRP